MFRFLVSLALVASISIPASDNFTRANTSEDPGANWSGGVASWEINSNHLVRNIDFEFEGAIWWNADSFSNDQSSEITITTFGTYGMQPTVHASGTYSSTMQFYEGVCDSSIVAGGWRISKVTTGNSVTTLNSGGSPANCSDGDVLKLEATGTTTVALTLKQNGSTIGTATDSSSPLNDGAPGIRGYTSSVHNAAVSLWTGDNVGGGGGPTFPNAILKNVPIICCRNLFKRN